MASSAAPGPSAPEREVIREALLNLLDARDFLGYQLGRANGCIDDVTFEEVVAGYLLSAPVTDLAVVAGKAEVLLRLLPPERLDSDALSVMLKCDTNVAEAALRVVAQRINTGEFVP